MTAELPEAELEVSTGRGEVLRAGAGDERAHGAARYSDGSLGALVFVGAAGSATDRDEAPGGEGDGRARGAASAKGDSFELGAEFQDWREDARRREEAEDGRVRGAASVKEGCAYFVLGEGDGQTLPGAESLWSV